MELQQYYELMRKTNSKQFELLQHCIHLAQQDNSEQLIYFSPVLRDVEKLWLLNLS